MEWELVGAKIMNRDYFIVCIVLFLLWCFIGFDYTGRYGLPFGMSDVDRYMVWINGGETNFIHFMTVDALRDFAHPEYTLDIFIPLIIWIGLPFLIILAYRSLGNGKDDSFRSGWLFIFGCFGLWYFQWTALWAELFSFFFFVAGLAALKESRALTVCCWLLGVLFHPMLLGVLVLFAVSEFIRKKRKHWILIGVLLVLLVLMMLSIQVQKSLVFFSGYPNEPNLYMMLFVYTCPLLVLFAFVGFELDRWAVFTVVLAVICPFIQLGRAMPFLQIFLAYYALRGYRIIRLLVNPFVFDIFCVFMFLLWVDYFFAFMTGNFCKELLLRNLPDEGFLNVCR